MREVTPLTLRAHTAPRPDRDDPRPPAGPAAVLALPVRRPVDVIGLAVAA